MKTHIKSIVLLLICVALPAIGQNLDTKNTTEWILADLFRQKASGMEINGEPLLVKSPYGEAVYFDGIDDAIFLNEMPLKSLPEFTVEMIFKPAPNAPFEQRVLHIGESRQDRMLLEIRAVDANWYFDGYACSGTNKKALIDEKLTHPLDQWYHVAFVVTPKNLTTYVNGKKELQEDFPFLPIETGQTSFGVRLNKVSWFKGTIYKIKITPKQIDPKDFIEFK